MKHSLSPVQTRSGSTSIISANKIWHPGVRLKNATLIEKSKEFM